MHQHGQQTISSDSEGLPYVFHYYLIVILKNFLKQKDSGVILIWCEKYHILFFLL